MRAPTKLAAGLLRRSIREWLAPLLIVCVGGVLTWLAYSILDRRAQDFEQVEIERLAGGQLAALQSRMDGYLTGLQSMVAFFSASQEVNGGEFNLFSSHLLRVNPGMVSVAAANARFDNEKMDFSTPVRVTFSLDRGAGGFPDGTDLGAMPAVREALNWARDAGEVLALADRRPNQPPRLLVIMPRFRGFGVPIWTGARRSELEGFVIGVIDIQDWISSVVDNLVPSGMDLLLYSSQVEGRVDTMTFRPSPLRPIVPPTPDVEEMRSGIHLERRLGLPGYTLNAIYRPDGVSLSRQLGQWPVLVVGAVISLLLAAFVAAKAGRERMIRRTVVERTRALSEANRRLENENTIRQNVEEALRHSEEQVKLALEGADAGLWDWDIASGDVYFSPRWEAMLGFDSGELPQRLETWEARVHPDELPDIRKIIQSHLDGETASYETEHRMRHKSGEWVWILARGKVVQRDERGKALRAVGTHIDITERKQSELQLRDAKDQAEVANKAKSEFLAMMSHEIRTPLNGVMGMLDLLLDSRLDAEEREFALTARSSAYDLLSLLNDILDISKLEAGKLELEQREFDLDEQIGHVLRLLTPTARDKGLDLALFLSPQVPARLVGDAGRLRQVLFNLVGNAVKFTAEGGATVSVSLNDRGGEDIEVRFEVADTGAGISREVQGKLFQNFTQADSSVSRRHGGTGLGLAISRRLVELMSGAIGLQSEPGRGSRFWFTARFRPMPFSLPMIPADLQRRALVVEDSLLVRETLMRQLAAWGFACEGVDPRDELNCLDRDWGVVVSDRTELVLSADRAQIWVHPISGSGAKCSVLDERWVCLTKPVMPAQLRRALCGLSVDDGESESAADELSTGAPLRVLVAEDNAVNRRLASVLLQREGHWVVTVVDGVEAVEAVRKEHFDLVLMDIQMPRMDGINATRAIRELGDGRAAIPIVALTANAMKGDREHYMASGMDDYLSKPIQRADLAQVLRGISPGEAGYAPVAEEGSANPVSILDEKHLAELEDALDLDDLHAILDEQRTDQAERLEALVQAIGRRDWDSSVREAHSLKGSLSNLGAVRASALALDVELACREHRGQNAEKELAALRRAANEALVALGQRFHYDAVDREANSTHHPA